MTINPCVAYVQRQSTTALKLDLGSLTLCSVLNRWGGDSKSKRYPSTWKMERNLQSQTPGPEQQKTHATGLRPVAIMGINTSLGTYRPFHSTAAHEVPANAWTMRQTEESTHYMACHMREQQPAPWMASVVANLPHSSCVASLIASSNSLPK